MNDTEAFLCRVAGGPGTSFHFRAIHDHDKGRHPANLYGTFEQCERSLNRLNQAGHGIFVTINEATGTTDATVTSIRAVFVDFDGIELPDRKERLLYFAGSAISVNIHKAWTGIAPMSMIVETSPRKYHIYWHCHAMPLDRFKPFQQALAHTLGGDPTVCNLARIMRVPGFLHQKGEPFRSRVLHVRSGHPNSVSADNLERALARTIRKFKVKVPEERVFVAATKHSSGSIDGLIKCIRLADEGERNDTLFWAACSALEERAPYAKERLSEAARQRGLPDTEIATTIASAQRRVEAKAQQLGLSI